MAVAVADARGRDRVRDQHDPSGRRAPGKTNGLVGEVVAVEDQLDGHVVTGERRAGEPGRAMP